MNLKRRFYSPSEAAAELGTDVEAVRQWALWFDAEPERIALYAEIKENRRVLWSPPYDPSAEFTYPRKYQTLNRDLVGRAQLFDVTEGESSTNQLISSEFNIGAGLWLEIDPMDGHEIAARPEESHNVTVLRAPNENIGPISAKAIITIIDKKIMNLMFGECWIAAEDLERIRAEREHQADQPLNPRELKNMLRLTCVLTEEAQKFPKQSSGN